MSVGIHQVLAGAAPRDAITNHALCARKVIRAMGFRSEVFADGAHLSRELPPDVMAHDQWDHVVDAGDRAILHYSIHSDAFEYVLDRAARVALHYHNVTPPELMWRDAPHIAFDCMNGRMRLADLAGAVDMSVADSQFNAAELVDLGFPDPQVVGILRTSGVVVAHRRAADGGPRLLFVGRGAPNKCQHDLVLAIAALRDIGVYANLRLVGSWGSNRGYLDRCQRLAEACGVQDQVHILNSVSDEDMAVEFAHADLFLCLSEHEGYGVPLVEAMEAGLPVVAYGAGAVPETVGTGGLLLDDKSPSMVAEAVAAVLDGALADRMAQGRATQLRLHSAAATTTRLQAFVQEFSTC